VKVGSGAFLPAEEDARALAEKMVAIGTGRGLGTVALLTAMDRPLGRAIGVGLETSEAIECLRGGGPDDLRELVLVEAAEMLRLAHPEVGDAEALARAARALDSGAALERFTRMVEAQGGDPRVVEAPETLRTAPERREVRAEVGGVVLEVTPRPLGEGVIALGGGRTMMHQPVDAGVGFVLAVAPGESVSPGDALGIVHARSAAEAELGARVLAGSVRIGDVGGTQVRRALVSARIGGRAG
jgi:thymidine phosphorylase